MINLKQINYTSSKIEEGYPFDLKFLQKPFQLKLTTPITYFVGENGSGKSTLLEAIAFHAQLRVIGSTNTELELSQVAISQLASQLNLRWQFRTKNGFLLKSEKFYENSRRPRVYKNSEDFYQFQQIAGLDLNFEGSHGETLFHLFDQQLSNGLYLLDEPEAGLSPHKQLALLHLIKNALNQGAQFIIATHSPIIAALPQATILNFNQQQIKTDQYSNLEFVQLTKDFLTNPETFLSKI